MSGPVCSEARRRSVAGETRGRGAQKSAKSEDIPTIAKRLLVAHVLEGSVRKSGNHMRITVQLLG
jgi:TolB-like protein